MEGLWKCIFLKKDFNYLELENDGRRKGGLKMASDHLFKYRKRRLVMLIFLIDINEASSSPSTFYK